MSKINTDELSDEIRSAVEYMQRKYGRVWKAKLLAMWIIGRYDDVEYQHVSSLQTLRNTFGPSGLSRIPNLA